MPHDGRARANLRRPTGGDDQAANAVDQDAIAAEGISAAKMYPHWIASNFLA